jgi:hypothetical protein
MMKYGNRDKHLNSPSARAKELSLSQCSKCGSEVPSDQIDWNMQFTAVDCSKALVLGILIGIALESLFIWIRLT